MFRITGYFSWKSREVIKLPWCRKCKTEYREGYDTCSDCGEDLVDVLDTKQNLHNIEFREEWNLLIQTFSENEAAVVEALLRPHDIPVLRKDRGAGGYLKIYGHDEFRYRFICT